MSDPQPAASPALIVPMDVAALLVGKEDVHGDASVSPRFGTKDFAKVAAEFQLLTPESKFYLSEEVIAAPFEAQSDALEPGIHLHYALPDSLARGVTDDAGNVAFRAAPNRFLVVRIASRQNVAAAAARLAAWVVEGDHVWTDTDERSRTDDPRNNMSRAVPLKPNVEKVNAPLFHYQGRASAYAAWTEAAQPRPAAAQPPPPHTALGYGAPDFAAAYAHAPNVFGFYDPMNDLAAGLGADYPAADSRLSYLVVAWYSDPTNDPVHLVTQSLTSLKASDPAYAAAFAAALKRSYGWTYAGGGPVPDRTFCVGLLTDIAWDASKYYVHARSGTPPQVAMGMTVVEALSAVMASKMASKPPDQHAIENVLNALQYGQLRQLEADAIDGFANLHDMLHERGFTTFAAGDDRQSDTHKIVPATVNTAGVIYVVKRQSPADPAKRPKGAEPDGLTQIADDLTQIAGKAGQPLPAEVAAALNELNEAQAAFDDLCLEVGVRRNQIFADWYKYLMVTYGEHGDREDLPDEDGIANYLNAEVKHLASLVQIEGVTQRGGVPPALAARHDRRDKLLTELLGLLEKSYPSQFELSSVPAPRYYQPADPVVLLVGPDVAPSFRHGGDGRHNDDGSLSCRLGASAGHAGDLLSAVTIAAGTAGLREAKTVKADTLPGLPAGPDQARNPRLASDLAALVADALLLDPNLAFQLAALAQPGNPGLVKAIQSAQNALAAEPLKPAKRGDPVAFAGVAPSPVGCQRHAPPWIPLLLQWEAEFQPFHRLPAEGTKEAYATDWVKKDFVLDPEDVEIVYRNAPPDRDGHEQIYRGVIVLTHKAELNLKNQIKEYVTHYPEDPKRDILAKIHDGMDFAMMAQALSGFHRALVMRKQTLQMPVFLPRSIDPVHTNTNIRNAVDDANDAVALPRNNYNPLRAGMLSLTKLRLVDAFGQYRDIAGPIALTRAASLVPTAPDDGRVLLPLRIAQPARLSFRFLAAEPGPDKGSVVEMNSDPASTPIFGWILFNRLDDSLAIYDADGTPRGQFNEVGIFWQGAPGNKAAYDRPFAEGFAGANPHLRAFANALYDRGRANKQFLAALLKTLDDSASRIVPASSAQDDALALLISRPFALIRANLSLDLYGALPAVSQSYAAMKEATDAPKKPDTPNGDGRYTAGFQHVGFPVRLGDITRVNDGLVGYFVETDAKGPYGGTLWAAAAPKDAPGIVAPPAQGAIALTAADSAPTVVTMIVDPRAPVHAFTGILPAKSIALPPAHYARPLQRIAVTFLTGPVLGHAEKMALPLPKETAHEWSWLTAAPDGHAGRVWTEQTPIFAPNPRAAFADLPQQAVEGWLRLFPATSAKPKSE